MLSLLSPKSVVSEKKQPHVVDFNTIKDKDIDNDKTTADPNKGSSFFMFWPFSSSNSSAKAKKLSDQLNSASSQYQTKGGKPLLLDASDKVIAMKKVNSSALDSNLNESTAAANELDDDEFIDIQLRQLSYAEVAALDLKNAKQSQQVKSKKNNRNSLENKFIVIDQIEDLEKSITDLEMVDSYRDHEKFSNNNDNVEPDVPSPEDEWDYYVDSKAPKKLIRKKKTNHKNRKPTPV